MDKLIIRALDPDVDWIHFRDAYNWRTQKRLARMPEGVVSFEDFSNPLPNEAALGMFNGQLEALFLIQDRGMGLFEVHFTNRQGLEKDLLAAGALTVKNRLFEQGAREIYGWLREKHARPNHPIRRFAESIGFFLDKQSTNYVIMHGDRWVWWRRFSAKR